ncbi:MAG: adenosylcobinamide-GDP ribazoletransferase [Spirochaetaceae bacterium]|jgi:adenosylcobinamide-GDP ribazoletransferase|nr:adenosylcobinamide-GDP ribazoletransferase [Spirochaetaceae bacterium]
MCDKFFSVLGLVCRIPFKVRYTFDLSRADFYLPIIGLFPAGLSAGAYCAVGDFANPLITALVMLIVQYAAFNLFHLDGLADTGDAFLGNFDREKRFAILKDSRIGVYGLFAVLAVLGLKTALLQDLLDSAWANPEIFGYPVSGRFAAALIPGATGPAKPDGLGVLLKGASPLRAIAGGLLALGLWNGVSRGILAVFFGNFFYATTPFMFALAVSGSALLAALVSLSIARMYRLRLGGYTGDALGAAVELGELAHLAWLYLLARL